MAPCLAAAIAGSGPHLYCQARAIVYDRRPVPARPDAFLIMQIKVNGQPYEAEDSLTAAALVERLGYAGRRLALEINREIVPRSRWSQTPLQADDEVELVHAIGGG